MNNLTLVSEFTDENNQLIGIFKTSDENEIQMPFEKPKQFFITESGVVYSDFVRKYGREGS